MHSVCCIHGQIHGQISLLASEVSKKAVAAPSWSSASSLFWKLPWPKLCFYLWSSIYCLSTEMFLSMLLVKSKWTKVMRSHYWNSLNQAMSAASRDDLTRLTSGYCYKQQFLKQLGNPELRIFFHFLFYHLVKCFHWLHLLLVLSGMTMKPF